MSDIDAAYRERAHLLAHLATIYPSHLQPDTAAPDWPVLYIDLPTGQACWHISEYDLDLFAHVRTDIVDVWDGHTTLEKYERLDRVTRIHSLKVERMSQQPDISKRNPAVQHLYRYFEYDHLPPKLQRVSRHFAITADLVLQWLPDSPELTVCLRKLLEAKDCAVRCALDIPDET